MRSRIFKFISIIGFVFPFLVYTDNTNDLSDNSNAYTSQNYNNSNYCSSCQTCPLCEDCDCCYKPCDPCRECCIPPCTEIPKTNQPIKCAYNAPARVDPVKGWHTWLDASFIYWQPREKGLDLGGAFSDQFDDVTQSKIKRIHEDFDFHPGFQAGFGLSFNRDDWTLYLEYTRLNAKDLRNKNLENFNLNPVEALESSWFASNVDLPYKNLKAIWTLNYNMFDLEIGRPHYLGKRIIFKPFIGLRSGWINQKISNSGLFNSHDKFFDILRENKSKTWLIGPRGGVNSDWLIGCNFKILANASLSLTYQNFKTSYNEPTPTPFSNIHKIFSGQNEISHITSNAELDLGFGWGKYFYKYKFYIDINICGNFIYFYYQNIMKNLNDDIINNIGNLTMHGISASAKLDF